MAQAQYMQQGYATATYPYQAYASPQQQTAATGMFNKKDLMLLDVKMFFLFLFLFYLQIITKLN